MRDDKTYELMKDNKIFFICIEARKCVKLGDKDKNHLIRWMHFFSNISQKNDADLAEKDRTVPVGLRDLLSSLNFNWYYIKVKPIFTSVIKL